MAMRGAARSCRSACPARRVTYRLTRRPQRCVHSIAASSDPAVASTTASTSDPTQLYSALDNAYTAFRKADPVEKLNASKPVVDAFNALKAAGALPKWGAEATDFVTRRTVFLGELKQMGIKNPDKLAEGSVRNDLAFIVTVVGVTSVLAVAAGQLPGDWGFFSSYLIGGISLVVLAIGSTAPGLLSVFINQANLLFPDYRERVARHEAGHFLVGYLLGMPVTGYSLDLGNEHTEFAEAKLQRRLFEGFVLSDKDIDVLSIMAVAGMAAEGLKFEEVMGQNADLLDLQRILNRSETKLSAPQQQNLTRWAVWQAAIILRRHRKEYDALVEAMGQKASVVECLKIIEKTA